jgi:SAM-dependent methyltransferase
MYHRDRRRAERFGEEAERYDRARPGYPQALVDDLMAESPRTVLDVGCGTGKAGQLLVERGCRVLGLEPDPRMAAVAARRGIDGERSTFEAWGPAGRMFDLLIAAQSWHWVDPAVGPAKAGTVLRPGGRIALFWTLFKHDTESQAVLAEIYRRVEPSLSEDSGVLGTVKRGGASLHIAQLAATGMFEKPRMRLYGWDRSYTTKEWLDQLPTHSDHRLLGPERLTALVSAVGAAIDERLGGSLHLRFEVWMITARRARRAPTRSHRTR